MKLLLLFYLSFLSLSVSAQVGINNTNPTALLDVTGNVKLNEKLFLENPGEFNEIRGSKLLIRKTDEEIVEYDIEQSKYGPINYAQLIFRNTGNAGVQNYDTKISVSNYLVTVQGFYFKEYGTNATSVLSASNSGNNVVEGFQAYAYKSTTTNTWFIRAFINNGYFRTNGNQPIKVDIYMNLIIFREGLIAKPINDVVVSMGGAETKTITPPPGF